MTKSIFKRIMHFSLLLICPTIFLQAQTPNILLVIADDLGTDALNGYTNQAVKPSTPTLDSLRNIGITFTNAWAAPECTPTRASMMSGKFGIKTGVMSVPGNLDTSHISLLRNLKSMTNDTYAKAVIGKWHISKPVNVMHPYWHGADYYMGFMDGFPDDYWAWQKTENNVTALETNYVTSTFTDRATTWTSQQTKPWFLWLAHAAPHSPLHVPPAGMYSIANTNNNTQKFIAMVESIDYELNRLLAAMSAADRANTIVIFIGDNGTPNNVLRDYPSGHGKSSVYEGGVRVPFIVAGKGVTRKGVTETAMINVADIHATVLELAGADLPGGIYNSLSFKHLLVGGSAQPTRYYNYSEIIRDGVYSWAIRNAQYKLIDLDSGKQEFYDLTIDSFETNPINMASLTTNQAAQLADLKAEAAQIKTSWSCRDHIQNGDETGIDCGGSQCSPCVGNIRDLEEANITIYPNPSSGIVTITSKRVITEIRLHNAEGRLLKSVNNINKTQYQFDLEKNASVIWCEIRTASGVVRKKIVGL